MRDDGGLTLTVPVDGEAVDRALVRLPPTTESFQFYTDELNGICTLIVARATSDNQDNDDDDDDGTPDGRTTTTTTTEDEESTMMMKDKADRRRLGSRRLEPML